MPRHTHPTTRRSAGTRGRPRRAAARPPRRARIGQHFLTDPLIAHDIVDAAELTDADTVLEIGPGGGALTEQLLERVGRVIAIELDERLAERLRQRHAGEARLTVVGGSVLDYSANELLAAGGRAPPYVVVANLPYYITAPVLRHLLERGPRPRRLVLMVQREVAEAICGQHGLSLLGVSVQVFAAPRLLFRVPPEAFRPPPRVQSAVVRLDCFAEPLVPAPELAGFFGVVQAGFRQPRKQLRNSLPHGIWLPPGTAPTLLDAAGIDPARRPGTLSIAEWLTLYRCYAGMRPAFAHLHEAGDAGDPTENAEGSGA